LFGSVFPTLFIPWIFYLITGGFKCHGLYSVWASLRKDPMITIFIFQLDC